MTVSTGGGSRWLEKDVSITQTPSTRKVEPAAIAAGTDKSEAEYF
jgi:hypothetical protein